jgi:hypothetical protein
MQPIQSEPLASDILHGAGAISEFLYGDASKRRRIYHLAETKQIRVFHLGQTICARRSTLRADIEAQEGRALAGEDA